MKMTMEETKDKILFIAKIMILSALWLQLPSTAASQTNNQGLELFKRFVIGQVPIKEAVVYRRISRPNGELINQDWVRFGYQDGSWHVERLKPDTNNPSHLIPHKGNHVCGASFSHLWTISDNSVNVAAKSTSAGSGPAEYGSFPKNFMEHCITMGIPVPTTGIQGIQWNDLGFTTCVATEHNKNGPTKTNVIKGRVFLGKNGLPASLDQDGVGKFSSAKVIYEYGSVAQGVPKVFTVAINDRNVTLYRYEYLSITLGKVDLEKTGGYIPQMFGDPALRRNATIWTNELPYTVLGNTTIPAFQTKKPKQIGSIVIGGVVVIIVTFLALAYRRWK